MDKSKVYYIPLLDHYSQERALESFEFTLQHRMFHLLKEFQRDAVVGMKINSVDQDGNGVISTQYLLALSELLNLKRVSPLICDTSWRFMNRSTNATKHMKTLFERGVHYKNTLAPFQMLDGGNGKDEFIVESENGPVYLAGGVRYLDGIVSFSVVTPYHLSGLRGTLYNIGFGLAAMRGKIRQYTMAPPRVNSERCYFCRKCIHQCPTNAIYVSQRKVQIDRHRCTNCGECVEIADYGGITYDWNATSSYNQKQLALYASSVIKHFQKKSLYINVIPDSHDNKYIGLLVSKDPLAIDYAALEILSAKTSILHESFVLLERAYDLKCGSKEYELVTINY